jgi:hypothetical protein
MNIKYYLLAVTILLCFACKQKPTSTQTSSEDARTKFVPDTTYSVTYFPWKHVIACMKKTLDSKEFANHLPCPKCGLRSENLDWINFRSPDWTWEHLCGRAGPLSICPECKIQVEFILHVMN